MGQDQILTERILDSLDEIRKELRIHSETMIRQQTILDEHVRRSLANEENLELLRIEIKPLKEAQVFRKKLFEYVGIMSTVASLVFSLFKIFHIV